MQLWLINTYSTTTLIIVLDQVFQSFSVHILSMNLNYFRGSLHRKILSARHFLIDAIHIQILCMCLKNISCLQLSFLSYYVLQRVEKQVLSFDQDVKKLDFCVFSAQKIKIDYTLLFTACEGIGVETDGYRGKWYYMGMTTLQRKLLRHLYLLSFFHSVTFHLSKINTSLIILPIY